MKGTINLFVEEENTKKSFTILEEDITKDSYEIAIFASYKTKANELLKSTQKFEEYLSELNQEIRFNSNWKKSTYDLYHLIKKHLVYSEDILEECDTIYLHGEISTISEFLMRNNGLIKFNKKLILANPQEISKETYEDLFELFGKYPNMYFFVQGNDEPITLEEYQKSLLIFDEISSNIKKYDYSPLEKLIHLYDIVRTRIYKQETKEEDITESRDLTKVLSGDKIVCAGYVNMFNEILKSLGIRAETYYLKNQEKPDTCHARSIIYIDDPKYDLKGIYLFDPTWDSKRDEFDYSYLSSYLFFGKTIHEFQKFDKKRYLPLNYKMLDEEIFEQIENTIEENPNPVILDKQLITAINEISSLVDQKKLINEIMSLGSEYLKFLHLEPFDQKKILEKLQEYNKLIVCPIKAEKLLMAIYNVRKNQYYEEKPGYQFDLNAFEEIVKYSHMTFSCEESRLILNFLFGITKHNEKTLEAMSRFFEEINLERQINQVKLAKVLRKVYTKKFNRNH